MTGKVKVTAEQAEAIETYKGNTGKMLGLMTYFVNHRRQFNGIYKSLKDIPLEDFARILYQPDSYEVEEEFKADDWLQDRHGHIGIVTKVEGSKVWGYWSGSNFEVYALKREIVKKLTQEEIKTEKERRVWVGIGREVGEFRNGDCVTEEESGLLKVIPDSHDARSARDGEIELEDAAMFYEKGFLKGFYPTESFISFEQEAETNA